MRSGKWHGRRHAAGFTYIGLLVLIALIGIMLAFVGEVAATTGQREREKQLLWVGHAYRNAIVQYFRANHRFPDELQDLVESTTAGPQPAHYLRRLYPDPMTGKPDWTLIQAPGAGIMGVASTSTKAPLKSAGFDDIDVDFDQAATYADWQFFLDPRPRRPAGAQGVRGITTVQ
jgi:type II secretory pathway pseudopilin PulG